MRIKPFELSFLLVALITLSFLFIQSTQGDEECWYRPVLFRGNEVCALLEFYGSQNIDSKEIYSLQSIIEQHCPLLYVSFLTTDGDAQLHFSPLG